MFSQQHFGVHVGLSGRAFVVQGKVRDALQMLQAALCACPTYAEAYNNLGVLQRDVGAIHVRFHI